MIRYNLRCDNDHSFDSWFASSGAYDTLRAAGQIACPTCGNTNIQKALMAPSVTAEDRPLSTPRTEPEKAIAQMRAEIEANSEHVGLRFAEEARAMHDGTAPKRQIHGEAKAEEARALIEDGVPVVPLPFLPKTKAN